MTALLEEALNTLLQHARSGQSEQLPLEQCFGRVLAADIVADIDFPPFDRSPLDGYAVRGSDVVRAAPGQPAILEQIDYVPAGAWPSKAVQQGQATRIMTGARIPDGADAVVRIEDTHSDGKYIYISSAQDAGKSICYQGEEIQKGEVVLTRGTCIRDGELSMLAMLGYSAPPVYKKPRVGILATGSELIDVSEPLTPGKIRDTNSFMLMGKVRLAGGEAVILGTVRDDIELMVEKLRTHRALPVYITTGGASVGDYDLMEALFARLDIPIFFKQVAIKPGMPVLAGLWGDSLFIALSGNPAASAVSFEVLVRPLLLKMVGMRQTERTRIKVKLCGEFKKSSAVRRFVWARWFSKQGVIFAEPLYYQGNGMLKSMLRATALLDIPANTPPLQDGVELEAILLS